MGKRNRASRRHSTPDWSDDRTRALVAAGALRPIAWPRVAAVVGVLTVGMVAAVTVAWPLALVAAAVAIRVDRAGQASFAVQRAAALVAIEARAPRRGWRRCLPLERAGPDMVLSRPLNGVLLVALVASVALVLVSATMLALTVVLFAAYACLGRPERAWVSKRAVRTYRSLAVEERVDAVASDRPAAAPGQPASAETEAEPAGVAEPTPLPMTGPAIVARIDAIARSSRPFIPSDAVATVGRIRDLAERALPAHDRPLNFTDHETWLVRQVACDYLPAAIERYRAIDPPLTMRPLADGRSARQVLADSLALIERYLRDAAITAWERDTSALLTHERFLADRFAAAGSLRIGGPPRTDDT